MKTPDKHDASCCTPTPITHAQTQSKADVKPDAANRQPAAAATKAPVAASTPKARS